MKRIHVVAAVIRGECVDRQHGVLLSKRPEHVHQGGKWEFPGGKVEAGESAEQALVRELKEEIGITATQYMPLIQIHHDYPDKSVFLDVWEVGKFTGEPYGVEGQLVEWVTADALSQYEFPAANVPIITAAQLPERYWVTPEPTADISEFINLIQSRLQSGIRLLQFRVKSMAADDLVVLLDRISQLKKQFCFDMMINSDCYLELLKKNHWDNVAHLCSGIHLTSSHLKRLPSLPKGKLLSASCHEFSDILQAQAIHCDFVTLSPVYITPSHPEAKPLNPEDVKEWVRMAKLPVFALGGVSDGQFNELRQLGFQGVAGIRQVGINKGVR